MRSGRIGRKVDREVTRQDIRKHILRPGNQPGYRLINHPRRFNKPLSCKSGLHKGLKNRVIQGVLCLYCTKCGMHIGQGLKDKTWSKQDIRKIKLEIRGKGRPNTKEESMQQSWNALEMLRRKFTEPQIQKMLRKRMFKNRGYRV